MAADSAQFTIDIATKLRGGDSAASQIADLSTKLISAKSAVADAEAAYKQAENAASRLAAEHERLGAKAIDLAAKMQKAMDAGDAAKFWRLAGASTALEEKIKQVAERAAQAQSDLALEGEALDILRGSASAAAEAHAALVEQQKAVAAAATDLARAADIEASQIDKAARNAASASAFKAQQIERETKRIMDARRRQHELEKRFAEDAKKTGKGTLANVDQLGTTLKKLPGPLGRTADGFGDTAQVIQKTVAQLGPMVAGILAAAIAVAALTIGFVAGTTAIVAWGIGLADAKRSADDVLKLSNQMKRFKKLIGETFGGLKTDKLMRGLGLLINLFDKSTASGRALQTLFQAMFQPIIDFLANHAADIERFFLGIVIGALKIGIAVKPLVRAFGELFDSLGLGSVDLATVGKWLAYVAAGAAALAALVGGALLVSFVTFAALLYMPIAAVIALVSAISSAIDFLSELDWGSIGTGIIEGLIGGISAGAGLVIQAVKGLGSSAMSALKSSLGIASPSKVFEEFGGYTAEGFAKGVEGGSGTASGAVQSMVDMPTSGGGGPVNVTINVTAPSGAAQDIAVAVRDALLSVFEGNALSLGGAPA